MNEIVVPIKAETKQYEAALARLSNNMRKLDAQTKGGDKISKQLEASRKSALSKLAKAQADARKKENEVAKGIKLQVAQQNKAVAANKARNAQLTKMSRYEDKLDNQMESGLMSVIGMGAALVAAAVGAGLLVTKFISVAAEAGKARENAIGMLDIMTGGKGLQTLSKLDGLAKQLGISIADTRNDFYRFGQAGLSEKQSLQLIKLTADLKASGKGADVVAEAVSKVLDHKGGAGTAAEMALLAKQAGVVGDGVLAAGKNAESLGGALTRLDNAKTEAFEKLWLRIGPSIDKAATAFSNFVTGFLESEKGKAILEGVGKAVETVATWLAIAFSDKNSSQAKLLGQIAGVLATAFVAVAAAVTAAVGTLAGMLAITGIVSKAIAQAIVAIFNFGKDMYNAGANLIQGLIDGVTAKAAELIGKVTGIATSVKNTIASVWQTHSPSKVAEKLGGYFSMGLSRGMVREAPDATQVAQNTIPSPAMMASAGAQSGGNSAPTIVIENISVPAGADSAAFARDIRRELQLMLSSMQLSKGLP